MFDLVASLNSRYRLFFDLMQGFEMKPDRMSFCVNHTLIFNTVNFLGTKLIES